MIRKRGEPNVTESEKLQHIVDLLRTSPKPRFVRAQPQQFERFYNANIAYGGVWLSRHKQVKDEVFDTVLVELTPEIQLLLKYLYQK